MEANAQIKKPSKLGYIKSLDGMRGLFCLMIIVAHWKLAFPIIPFGWEALQTFFVMSGFLITRILLHEKESKPSFGGYTKSFYLKRLYRIFPLYFGYLIVMSLLRFSMRGSEFIQTQTAELEHSGVWLYTYLYNFKTWFNFKAGLPFEDTAFFSHLWSLSVEEQFYLIFPFLIYFLRGRMLKGVIIAMIIVPQFIRIFGYPYLLSVNPDPDWAIILIYRNIVFQIDALSIGAALAIFNFSWIKRPKLWFNVFFIAVLVVHAFNYPIVRASFTDLSNLSYEIFKTDGRMNILGYIHFLGHPEVLQFGKQFIYMMPLVNLWCFFMVLSAMRGTPVWKPLLENKFVVFIGKISYGMYVYHFALMVIFMKLLRAVLPVNPIELPYILHFLLFFVYLGLVILVSYLSFNYFEMFFLKMKKRIS
ncbi:MAG: acyltransferase [Chitinophagales bacterium]